MATIIDIFDYVIVLKQEIQKLNQAIQQKDQIMGSLTEQIETLNKEKLSKK